MRDCVCVSCGFAVMTCLEICHLTEYTSDNEGNIVAVKNATIQVRLDRGFGSEIANEKNMANINKITRNKSSYMDSHAAQHLSYLYPQSIFQDVLPSQSEELSL